MSTHPDQQRPEMLLPNSTGWPTEPGAVAVRLETTRSRQGAFDGAWWPSSRDLGEQLPGLIAALTPHIGPIERVGLDASAWDDVPGRMLIGGRAVHIDWFPTGDDSVILTRGPHDHFLLLVIPPTAHTTAAHAAMASAVLAGGTDSAQQILVKSGITQVG
jgi:hypothetical protein